MDFWSIAGNIVASIIVGTVVLIFGRWRGWWLKAKAKRERGAADPTKFAILIADLDGDAERAQTRHVLQTLRTQLAEAIERGDLQVLSRGEALHLPAAGDIRAAEIAVEKQGRAWLKEQNASVLVWGEVAEAHKKLRLRFLQPEGAGGAAKPYDLNANLELPANFGADLGAIIAVQATTAITPVYERSGEALAEIMAPLGAKLRPLAENPPAGFSDDTKAQLWHAYATGEARLGEERGDNARLETAIRFFRRVLDAWTRERVPLDWAMTQNDLGNALMRFGEREAGEARLEEAVSAYREALKERTRERVPLDRAMTQNNLGNALRSLGEREAGEARLEEAVAAFREALKEWTRERVPLDWAMTQNNLGGALKSLGERQAAADKTKGCAALEAARGHVAAALEEFQKAGASYFVEGTQENIARLCG